METEVKTQWINEIGIDDHLTVWMENFVKARKSENLSAGTLQFYYWKLLRFEQYCDTQAINRIEQITPVVIRDYLTVLDGEGRTPGGTHCFYRALKTFLRWYWEECEPDHKNPIERTKAPRLPQTILPPVELAEVADLLNACKKRTTAGLRDQAILLTLLDTGCRASELLDLDIPDFDQSGEMQIRSGKGRKSRTVFTSERTRRAIRQYLRKRSDPCPALFINQYGSRLKYNGLRACLMRLAHKAGIKGKVTAHMFRRCFALETLRAGGDLYTLQRQMGHSDLQVLQRYLRLTTDDVRAAHAKTSPVDRL